MGIDEVFQVFVIGGTRGEIATVQFQANGDIKLLTHEKISELEKFSTDSDFLSFIKKHLMDSTKAIGINFAFTLVPKVGPKRQLDGVMISGDTKGHAFAGLQKESIGSAIEQYLERDNGRELIASVGNDTVCLIASGTNKATDRTTLAAGIVGTGYNMAFFLNDNTIVNLQASDFTGFEPTSTGKIVDAASTNRGEQLFNKEVAAGELYKHFNALVAEGKLHAKTLQSTAQLAELSSSSRGTEGEAARALFLRSASLVAAQIAGFYDFKKRPPKLTFVMQGSLFWKGPHYQEMVLGGLEGLGVTPGAIDFKQVDHSDILGAAKLVTGGL